MLNRLLSARRAAQRSMATPVAPYVAEPLEQRIQLAAFLVLNGGQVPTPAPLFNVSADATNGQSEMLIAINPTNPLNVVGFSHRLTNPITLDLYRSADGGATWTTTRIDNSDDGLGSVGNRFDPAITFDSNGVLYIAYGYRGSAVAPLRNSLLIAATSTDGGQNFGNFRTIDSQPDILTADTTDNDMPGVDRWTLTTGRIAGTNNLCAVMAYTQNGLESGNTDQRITVVGTNNAGANWTAPLVINDQSNSGTDAGNLAAHPAIGFDGNLSVSWWDGGTSIFIDHDRDGLFANTFNFGAETAARTNQGLVNIGPPGPPAQPTRGLKMSPVMIAHPNISGELYMTFQERFGTTGVDTDIWFGRSTNFGVNWTFSTVETSTSTDFHPMISVDQHSNMIGIAYYTTDGDQGSGNDDVRMRIALSRDFGTSWGKADVAAQQSNEAGGYGGDYLEYTGLALRDGTAHVLWASRYPLPVPPGGTSTELDAFWARVSYDSTTNGNRLDIVGTPTGASNTYLIRRSPANSAYLEVFMDGVRDYTGLVASIDSINIAANRGNDTFRFENLPAIPVTIDGTVFDDGFNIDFVSGVSSLTINGYDGNDTITLGTGVSDFLTINSIVNVFGGNGGDTLHYGFGNGDAINNFVFFDGGGSSGSGLLDNIQVNDGAQISTVEYVVEPSALTRHSFLPTTILSYQNVSEIEIFAGSGADFFTVRNNVSPTVRAFGNSGNDNFTFGDGTLTPLSGHVFNGGPGNDTLSFDDRNDATGRPWLIFNDRVIFAGAFVFLTTGFEGVGVLGGTGGDTVDMAVQTFAQEITIDTGLGNDLIRTNGAIVPSMIIRGGGGTFDNLEMDDRGFPAGGQAFATIAANSIDRFYPSATMFTDIDGLEGVTYYLPPSQNEVQINSISSNIPGSNSFQILGNSSVDTFLVYPTPGTPNIGGPLYVTGGGGVDQAALVDFTSAGGTYTLANPVGGAAFIFGTFATGAGYVGVQSDIENLNLYGGGGNDTFNVDQFQSGQALAIYGGGGNDNCRLGNGNMQANLTSASAFTFDGGTGTGDRFTISNGVTNTSWTYRVGNNFVQSGLSAGGYSWHSNTMNIESQYLMAGSSNDTFNVDATAPGLYTECNGFGAADVLFAGWAAFRTDGIRSPIQFNAGAGGGRISVINTSGPAGTAHQDANTIGAYAGDNLFGVGGSLSFTDVTDFGATVGVSITVASNSTVYAVPLANARVEVSSGIFQPASGSIRLGLAGVQSPVISGTAASGNVTSANRQMLSWFSFTGSVITDAVAPAVVQGNLNVNGIPGPGRANANRQAVDVQFSENVSGLISPNSLQLTNLTTGQVIPAANIAVSYDLATNVAHFTFPGYPNGVLPDGNYTGRVFAGLPDFFGNPLPADATFNFFVLAGDANRDRKVDIADLGILASNWQQSGKTFADGDFDYSGTVNIADLGILASNWQKQLAAPSAPSPASTFSRLARSPARIAADVLG